MALQLDILLSKTKRRTIFETISQCIPASSGQEFGPSTRKLGKRKPRRFLYIQTRVSKLVHQHHVRHGREAECRTVVVLLAFMPILLCGTHMTTPAQYVKSHSEVITHRGQHTDSKYCAFSTSASSLTRSHRWQLYLILKAIFCLHEAVVVTRSRLLSISRFHSRSKSLRLGCHVSDFVRAGMKFSVLTALIDLHCQRDQATPTPRLKTANKTGTRAIAIMQWNRQGNSWT